MTKKMRVENSVFLSYRRTNTGYAVAVFQNLKQHGFDAFLDFEGIGSGDFERKILENIRSRAHFVVLLTPSALDRCENSEDWLRQEIEAALDSRRNIVPLTFEGFDFGDPGIARQLTGKLELLKHYNTLSVPAQYFEEAMARLRERYLNVPLDAVLHPASSSALQFAEMQKAAASKAPLVLQTELAAEECFERGFNSIDLDEKIHHFTEAIRLKPEFGAAHIFRGLARIRKGGGVAAFKEDILEGVRLQPNDAWSYYGRGILMMGVGLAEANDKLVAEHIESALSEFDEAIRLEPGVADFYRERALAREKIGDLDGAVADWTEVIRLHPDEAVYYTARGYVRRNKKDYEGAASDFTEALRLQPGNAWSYKDRSDVRLSAGDNDGALEDLNQAIRLKPDAEMFMLRGMLRLMQGKPGAKDDFTEAESLQPGICATYSDQVSTFKATGHLKGASEHQTPHNLFDLAFAPTAASEKESPPVLQTPRQLGEQAKSTLGDWIVTLLLIVVIVFIIWGAIVILEKIF